MGNKQPPSVREYQPFANVERRNLTQELIEVPAMIRLLGLPRYRRMLEIGCGRGIALPPLASICQPSRLTGLDIDPELTGFAKERMLARGIAADLVTGDVRNMPFPDSSFDVVIDFGTCYHIAYPEQALLEISRVLFPGGIFVFETPLSQFFAHPVRAWGKRIPWTEVPELRRDRSAGLWAVRKKLV